jgi:hypothetical protein
VAPITQLASQQIVQGSTASATVTFQDQNGEPRAPIGTVTVQAVRSDGTVLKAAGTGTTTGIDGITVIVPLTPAETSILDVLTFTWSEVNGAVATTVVEILGGHYFTLAYARQTERALQDTVKYPDADLLRVRKEVEIECERITGRSFIPRFRLDQADAGAVRRASPTPIRLAKIDVRTIRWVKVMGVKYAAMYYELDSSGRLYFGKGVGLAPEQIANGPWRGDLPVLVEIGYEYGWPSPPDDLKRATVLRLRYRLTSDKSSISERATALTTPDGTFPLSTPGMRGARTGIPEVDEIYDDYTRKDQSEGFVGTMRIA